MAIQMFGRRLSTCASRRVSLIRDRQSQKRFIPACHTIKSSQQPVLSQRWKSTSAPPPSRAPDTFNRGPVSQETTTTDFSALNVLGGITAPTTNIDACLPNGFIFDSGLSITDGSGCLLVGGEALSWCPWENAKSERQRLLNPQGQWKAPDVVWGVLDLLWPKPDILILGLGAKMHLLAPQTRSTINSMGISVDVSDTRNAAAQFNLLATERGVGRVAAALLPISWS